MSTLTPLNPQTLCKTLDRFTFVREDVKNVSYLTSVAAKLLSLRVRKRGALSQEATELKSVATIVNLFANLCPQIAAGPSIFEENSDYLNSFCKKERSNLGGWLLVYCLRARGCMCDHSHFLPVLVVMRGMNKIGCIGQGFIGGHMADDFSVRGRLLSIVCHPVCYNIKNEC